MSKPNTIEEVDAEIAKLETLIAELKAARVQIELKADPEAYIAKRVQQALAQAKKDWEASHGVQRRGPGRPKGSTTKVDGGAGAGNGIAAKKGSKKVRGRAPSLDETKVLEVIRSFGKPIGRTAIAAALKIDKASNALSGAIARLRASKAVKMDGDKGSAVYSAR